MSNNYYKMSHRPIAESSKNKFKQGYFHPVNPEKYVGNLNLIIYRSSWEFYFCQWCDATPKVVNWSSEPISIKYFDKVSNAKQCAELGLNPNDPKNWILANYHIDFMIDIKVNDEGDIERWMIEVKPACKLKAPEPPIKMIGRALASYNKALKEFIINTEKFKAAEEYALKHGYKFHIFTEETFKSLGINLI